MKKKGKSKDKNKALENSMTEKFMQVLQELGLETDKLKKEVAKAAKAISKKVSGAKNDGQKKSEAAKAEKPKTKDVKNQDNGKAKTKTDKIAAVINKATAGKTTPVSSRSVKKPEIPISQQPLKPDEEKDAVKEASAEAPVKRKRAPRTPAANPPAETTENKALTEPPSPEKKKRGQRTSKTGPIENKVTSAEITGSNVLR